MISDIFVSLVASFVVYPLQAEIGEKVRAARQPVAILAQAQACIASQGPKLIERATSDWGWAATTAIRVPVGFTRREDLLDRKDPACSHVIRALNASAVSGS